MKDYIYDFAAHYAHQAMEKSLWYPPASHAEFLHTKQPANHVTIWRDGEKIYDSTWRTTAADAVKGEK